MQQIKQPFSNQRRSTKRKCKKKISIKQIFNEPKKNKNINYMVQGRWTDYQNQVYIRFVRTNIKILMNQYSRKKRKIFQKMSQKIITRTAEQCRTHHQKAMELYGNQKFMIEAYQSALQIQIYSLSKLKKFQNLNEEDDPQRKDSIASMKQFNYLQDYSCSIVENIAPLESLKNFGLFLSEYSLIEPKNSTPNLSSKSLFS